MKKIILFSLLIVFLIVVACSPSSQLPAEEGFDKEATALAGQATKLKFAPVDSCSKGADADSSEFVKGTLQFTKKGKSYSYEDKCYKSGLIEYYCDEGKGVARAGVKCENGGEEGAWGNGCPSLGVYTCTCTQEGGCDNLVEGIVTNEQNKKISNADVSILYQIETEGKIYRYELVTKKTDNGGAFSFSNDELSSAFISRFSQVPAKPWALFLSFTAAGYLDFFAYGTDEVPKSLEESSFWNLGIVTLKEKPANKNILL